MDFGDRVQRVACAVCQAEAHGNDPGLPLLERAEYGLYLRFQLLMEERIARVRGGGIPELFGQGFGSAPAVGYLSIQRRDRLGHGRQPDKP
nr:hypothetical protein [Arthrobacter sp. TB 26]